MEGLEEGMPSANNLPVNHCVVKGSFNKVFMTGESSSISVNVFKEKEEEEISNRDSGYDDDPYQMDSAANDQEVIGKDQCENDDPVPMEMEERLMSCIVHGSENMVIMSGDKSTIKVNSGDSRAEDNIPEKNYNSDINANNNNINNNPCPVQKVGLNSLPNINSESNAKLLDDGIDVGERPVAHVQPVPREIQNNQEMPSISRSHSSNTSTSSEFEAQNMSVSHEISQSASGHSRSRPTDESSQMNIDPPVTCSKRRMDDEENREQLYKKQKVTTPQECAGRSCQTYHRVNIEGSNNTAITAGSGSTVNLNYYQCKHAQDEETKKDDYSIDHIDGEVLKKTGMMSFFERISKHMGSTRDIWKRLARELPMVGYESLEREIKVLERKQLTTEQKAFTVLVKWWKGNSGAKGMKRTLVVALRQIKLPWLANSLEKEIESFA
ncbi:uncharacterized protein LOC117105274 [Anneissia japonica]|uniref:uncharacterized protein LOC117105274 n=1 Tax=Anneissia japonica TaxID=1529436 RepID=UPI001425B4DC|nr:uncharacterized protein LOC117105274 [Anneissia japonica]XP_033102282.1 uncharacterized protein LOC117105274 [Anneissia japonica]